MSAIMEVCIEIDSERNDCLRTTKYKTEIAEVPNFLGQTS